MKKKILLVAGARPNFMKIAPLYRELVKHPEHFDILLVHTGQHYDLNMSDAFFRDLELPAPDVYLEVGSGSHAHQTGNIMIFFEKTCLELKPDFVIVVGDVNSTMACAIVAAKLNIPIAHVEAGLRSRDRTMPEEINRIVTDSLSDLLLTPSRDADENLLKEGIHPEKIHFVGNIMIDSLQFIMPKVKGNYTYERHGLKLKDYGLITLHRPSNVDAKESLKKIVAILVEASTSIKIVFPVHPRTSQNLNRFELLTELKKTPNMLLLEPLGYLEFMNLLVNSRFVLTDSGGIQEETTWLGIPCITLRSSTERPVTVVEGTNELAEVENVGGLIDRILAGAWKTGRIPDLWDGEAAKRIADVFIGALAEEVRAG